MREKQLLEEVLLRVKTTEEDLRELLHRHRVVEEKLLMLTRAFAQERPVALASRELPAPPWKHLVARAHPWRRQLYIRGRNMTVRQLIGAVKANDLGPEEAAEDLGIPVEAIHEALEYAEKNKHLLESDAAYERHLLSQGGLEGVAPPLPG